MPCNRIQNALDDFLDGICDREAAMQVSHHLDECADCREVVERERILRSRLKALPVEGPSESFRASAFDKARSAAANTSPTQSASRIWRRSLTGSLAAAVLVLFVASFLFDPSARTPSAGIPEVAISVEQTTPVNLVFSSKGALSNARVTLQLPEGIALAGYDGRRALRWMTELKDGKNVLQLPLVGQAGASGEIVALLEHEKGSKTFRLKVTVI
ncbi:MAG: zf-HC2 domain-containing protein [Gammaproteobacteria bacterium]|nr:zf-HC2 domain-containing protein [Gammaproteobacteria bacterium]